MFSKIASLLVLFAALGSASVSCTTDINPTGILGGDVEAAGSPVGTDALGCLTAAGGGLTVSQASGPWNDLWTAWSITKEKSSNPLVNVFFHYDYTFTDPTPEANADLAYLLLGISPTCETASSRNLLLLTVCIDSVTGATIDSQPKTYTNPPNTGMPAPLWALKLDANSATSTLNISFDSTRRPVWQDFYVNSLADGSGLYAYNAGFGLASGIPGFFLAAPDTEPVGRSVTPEPRFFVLIAAGLGAALFGAKLYKRRHALPAAGQGTAPH